jgi:aromatic ring-opening dioxygenase catalytic subunit (LigB family)
MGNIMKKRINPSLECKPINIITVRNMMEQRNKLVDQSYIKEFNRIINLLVKNINTMIVMVVNRGKNNVYIILSDPIYQFNIPDTLYDINFEIKYSKKIIETIKKLYNKYEISYYDSFTNLQYIKINWD